MPDPTIYLILSIVVPIIILAVLYKIARKLFKWIIVFSILSLIITIIFGINVLRDVQELQEQLPKAEKLFLLKDDKTLLAGFAGKLTNPDEIVSYINQTQLASFQKSYIQSKLQNIQGSYFKLFIIDKKAFEAQTAIREGNKSTNAKDILNKISSKDTLSNVVDETVAKEKLPNTKETRAFIEKTIKSQYAVATNDDMRGLLFAQLFSTAANDPFFLFVQFKEKNLEVYPETITFKLARMIPLRIIELIAENVVGSKDGNA